MIKSWLTCALASLMAVSGLAQAADSTKPNIIFVLADDLGMDGVSCYGADHHQTPHIDALAASGTRFDTCYAAPVCGPSRCLLMTGRYAFRTGGLVNPSWRAGGPANKAADEYPMAAMLKQAGYVTGQAGKWRQMFQSPGDWGFDEFLTDEAPAGWYWETRYNKNGKQFDLPLGTYGPDAVQDFTFDFIRRHKDKPFFFYYASHLVHRPTVRTPDTSAGVTNIDQLYDDNIKYVDKQVGALVDELEKDGIRNNTLILFAGDNGTATGYPSSVRGRMLNGWKGSMLEGGAHVPFIANWPGVTPAGKVSSDIVSFADAYATFAELAGATLPDKVKIDGQSFAAQLHGDSGTPRKWAYVQYGEKWYVREANYKLNESGDLFEMSDAPFTEKPIAPANDTQQSKAARQRLTAALSELNPAAGKTDKINKKPNRGMNPATEPTATTRPTDRSTGPWKKGDALPNDQAPLVANKSLDISAEIDAVGTDGLIIVHGRTSEGYAIYVTGGKLAFAVREKKVLTTIIAKEPLGTGHFVVKAALSEDGSMALLVDGKPVAKGSAGGAIPQEPKGRFAVGVPSNAAVGDYDPSVAFSGNIRNVTVKGMDDE